jgi:hypothetical protein
MNNTTLLVTQDCVKDSSGVLFITGFLSCDKKTGTKIPTRSCEEEMTKQFGGARPKKSYEKTNILEKLSLFAFA